MASEKEYLEYVLEQLSDVPGVTYRPMMGEFILYARDKIIGGIYDDRLLVKITKASARLMPDAPETLPYEGAKPMLLVENVEDRDFLARLITAMEPELPAPKSRKPRK